MTINKENETLTLIRNGTNIISFYKFGIQKDALIMQMYLLGITTIHNEAKELLAQLKKDNKITETEDSRIILKEK
jgi:hypothetical protein